MSRAVFVVMANDAVDAVFSTEALAKKYVAKRKAEDNPSGDGNFRRVYWQQYKLTIDEEGHAW